MAVTLAAKGLAGLDERTPLINEFSVQVATVNGSGSQSANLVLLRSLFQMGLPVSGKNLFPSNIAGLPTWFTIRVSERGFLARQPRSAVMVAMNAETIRDDEAAVASGGVFLYNADFRFEPTREDIAAIGIPFGSLVATCCPEVKLRKLVTNMVYVGVLAAMCDIELTEVEKALQRQFNGKEKAVALNRAAIDAGFAWAGEHVSTRLPYRVERRDLTGGRILVEGNRSAAMGCLFAGCTVVAWYPITPSSSLCETLISLLEKHRIDPGTGKATFAVVQAEDELASAGVVFGAGWAGARAMTATSGPGISLMNEFVGLGYFTEIPGVFFDVQRVGPSTGMPTRTQQGDVLSLYLASHGDTRHVVLIPGNPREAFDLSYQAFDLAERLQTPVFVMLDLDLGMNLWMTDPFAYPEAPLDRGPVVTAEELEARVHDATRTAPVFARYRDVHGDGIPERTLPGTDHPLAAYFTRGSGHTEEAKYTEKPEEYVRLVDRLARKHETARGLVPAPVVDWQDAEVTLVSYGSSCQAIDEARALLAEAGVPTNGLRLMALPFHPEVREVLGRSARIYVIDQNRDAQMADLLRLELGPEVAARIRSIRHYDGMPLDAGSVVDPLLAQERT
ncbi:MAG: 2-oxoacid:acceptor oxidoreductase subunit alpha [bacterium]|nr:2-oxoacid:acceptor oxidoreductase subunit alpha [bacterium]